jgi:hypothetical protein
VHTGGGRSRRLCAHRTVHGVVGSVCGCGAGPVLSSPRAPFASVFPFHHAPHTFLPIAHTTHRMHSLAYTYRASVFASRCLAESGPALPCRAAAALPHTLPLPCSSCSDHHASIGDGVHGGGSTRLPSNPTRSGRQAGHTQGRQSQLSSEAGAFVSPGAPCPDNSRTRSHGGLWGRSDSGIVLTACSLLFVHGQNGTILSCSSRRFEPRRSCSVRPAAAALGVRQRRRTRKHTTNTTHDDEMESSRVMAMACVHHFRYLQDHPSPR